MFCKRVYRTFNRRHDSSPPNVICMKTFCKRFDLTLQCDVLKTFNWNVKRTSGRRPLNNHVHKTF